MFFMTPDSPVTERLALREGAGTQIHLAFRLRPSIRVWLRPVSPRVSLGFRHQVFRTGFWRTTDIENPQVRVERRLNTGNPE